MVRGKSRVRLSRRDAKVEMMKVLMDMLASKGYVPKDSLGISSVDRFRFYCESVGGVLVNYYGRVYCKRKDFEFKVVRCS